MDDQAVHARAALEQVCARGDLGRARELYASDFVDHVNALEFRGQAGIARSVALYGALFPDLRIEVVDQGDRVVSRWTLHGTHRGRRVTLPGITISRFQDGQIAEDWTVSDNHAAAPGRSPARLGARPALRDRPGARRLSSARDADHVCLGRVQRRDAEREAFAALDRAAASIARSVSRARWQPPDNRGQTVASAAR